MNMKALFGVLLACFCHAVFADPYYTGTRYTPYPPGCVTLPSRQADLFGDNVALVYSGRVWLDMAYKLQSTDPHANTAQVDMAVYRVGCAEPNRSMILVEFKLTEKWMYTRLILPSIAGEGGPMDGVPLELKSEPNGWGQSIAQNSLTMPIFGDYTNGFNDARLFTWRYVVDVSPAGQGWDPDYLVDYYNGPWRLAFFAEDGSQAFVVDIPATEEVLEPNPDLPFNGRLSGVWVEQGSADQGLIISFSNPVPPAGSEIADPEFSDLTVFLSWYTFDSQGNLLWLTGANRFPQGAAEVSIPIELVTHGQFLGDEKAERSVVGELQLRARQCNSLQINYDLGSLGLGSGEMHLQRAYALEIAGYPCRDYKARRDSLSQPTSH